MFNKLSIEKLNMMALWAYHPFGCLEMGRMENGVGGDFPLIEAHQKPSSQIERKSWIYLFSHILKHEIHNFTHFDYNLFYHLFML